MSKIVVGIAQLRSNEDITGNLKQILTLIDSIKSGVDIVFFPENSLYFRIKESDKVHYFDQEAFELKQIAKSCINKKIHVHIGSVPFMENGVPGNSSILITAGGKIVKSYTKIHLFDIQLNEEKAMRESDCFRRGETPVTFTFKGWKFGQTICYDIRFSELYRYYGAHDVDILLIPAAFLKKTGQAHWHILNRARAIENQAYVISSAQMGGHVSKDSSEFTRETFGHSLCVSPWGEILVDIETAPSIEIIELNKAQIENVKKQIPMKDHRWMKSFEWNAKNISLDNF